MPHLDYDPLDVLECLGVVPTDPQEDGIEIYNVVQEDLGLELVIVPYYASVSVSLSRKHWGKPLLTLHLVVRGRVRYAQEKWGKWLEFPNSLLTDDHYPLAAHETAPPEYGVTACVAVAPHLRVWFE